MEEDSTKYWLWTVLVLLKKKHLLMISGSAEENGSLYVWKVVLSSRLGGKESRKIVEHAFLHYIVMICPMNIVDETLGCEILQRSTGNEVHSSLKQGTKTLQKRELGVGDGLELSLFNR